MCKFLNINEKLKRVRKENDITQEELAFGIYTQGYITSIERGIKKPTEENIKLLVEKINEILSKRKIEKKIDLDYFLTSKEDDEKEFIKLMLEEIDKIDNEKNLKNLFIRENLTILKLASKRQIKLYKKMLEKSTQVRNYSLTRVLCTFLINKIDDGEEKVEVILELTRACAVLRDPKSIESIEKEYEELLTNKVDQKRKLIYQNLSLIYRTKGFYNRSLFYLNKMLDLLLSNEQRLDMLMAKGYTFYKMKEYKKSIKIYKNIIKKRERGKEYLYWAKLNLCEVYLEMGEKEEIKKNYSLLKKNVKVGKEHLYGLRSLSLGKIAYYLDKNSDGRRFILDFFDFELKEPKIYRELEYLEGFKLLLKNMKKKDKNCILNYLPILNELKSEKLKNEFIYNIISFYNRNKLYVELNNFIFFLKEENPSIVLFYDKNK